MLLNRQNRLTLLGLLLTIFLLSRAPQLALERLSLSVPCSPLAVGQVVASLTSIHLRFPEYCHFIVCVDEGFCLSVYLLFVECLQWKSGKRMSPSHLLSVFWKLLDRFKIANLGQELCFNSLISCIEVEPSDCSSLAPFSS